MKGLEMLNNKMNINIEGYLKISDVTDSDNPITLRSKKNAIHYEQFSMALAQSISNQGTGFIYQMNFGNGGSRIDPTGIITYLTPNTSGLGASLYNQTYSKIVDPRSTSNIDPARNFMETRHISGMPYTDVLVSCLLDFGEPRDQFSFDNSTNQDEAYVFDELGLFGYNPSGENPLLTHVIFHPVQKSLNRMIQIDYTVRIQSLTGM
jgi:hypothetical protein